MRPEPVDDGLLTPEVGRWSKQKYHFLGRYLDLFSTGMKKKWPQRHYIDLFAGAGLARIRGTNEIVFGSPLLAATARDPFSALHLCDADGTRVEALRARLDRWGTGAAYVYHGDANAIIQDVLSRVPRKNALCLTFVDPYGLHFDFETARRVSDIRSDLIILFADDMDAMRNMHAYYSQNPDSSLDRFMGESGWRDLLHNTSSVTASAAERLRKRYQDRLRDLGYQHFGHQRIHNDGGRDIYSLVFASRVERGLNFWEKARNKDEGGQHGLFRP